MGISCTLGANGDCSKTEQSSNVSLQGFGVAQITGSLYKAY
jgi:hypothetical protein